MFYDGSGNYYGGMTLIWWFVWLTLLFWIFLTPYDIPGQRSRRKTALDVLQNRFASGSITNEEYQEKKAILEHDLAKQLS
jgi:putative membrane protein